MNIEKRYFYAEDGAELFGLLHKGSSGTNKEVVIATHGMASDCSKKRDDIIAKTLTDNGVDYFTYNNRGFGIINAIKFDGVKKLQGMAYEDVEEGYYDIVAAINLMLKEGYESIHLQGHSLGSTKTVFTYNELISRSKKEILNHIKSVILLSLVDVTEIMAYYLSKSEVDIASLLDRKCSEGDFDYLINTNNDFMEFISVKTLLRYYRDNKKIDFAKYSVKDYNFEQINNISVPLFMRWGNTNELISIEAERIKSIMNERIKNSSKDIGYIDGANHNYRGKEAELANEILSFIKKYN